MRVVSEHDTGRPRRRHRRRRLRSLEFVPTVITLGNLLCGFAAIHFAMRAMHDFGAQIDPAVAVALNSAHLERMLPSFLSVGAGLVILGMVFDMFDGLMARVTRSTTNFGGQLDSLADVVSFGVAPATLVVAFMTQELARESIVPSPISADFLGRATWVSAAIFVAFAAIRLARFNVEHAKDDFDYRTFRGLPSPGAAAIVVAFILFQDQPEGALVRRAIAYSMPIVVLSTAFLMVSRVPYKRFHRAYLVGRKPFGQFMVLVILAAAFWSYKAPTLLAIAIWYGLSGPIGVIIRRLRERPQRVAIATATTSQNDERKHA